ncbi:MAG: gluconokinase, partial [Roseivirga sp.]
ERLIQRKNHFMPTTLIKSQIETLEIPKEAIIVESNQKLEDIIDFICPYFQQKE